MLDMKILISDLGRVVYLKMSSASAGPFSSILILDLQLVCRSKSLQGPLLIGRCGPKGQGLEVWLLSGE